MSDPGNTWTDERVEQLRKLWGDGLSASQIANEIGGVSRNAVIGKVHRLGLSGRTKTPVAATTARPARKAPAPAPEPAQAIEPVVHQTYSAAPVEPAITPQPIATTFADAGYTAARVMEMPAAELPVKDISLASEVAISPSERVTIMDLREFMCRWPVGDPTSPSFRFCGARSVTGMPYCTHHASIAYQPVMDRRRDRKRA